MQCCAGNVSFQWERPFLKVSPLKTVDRSKLNLAQMMTVLTLGAGTKVIASAQFGAVAAFCFLFYFLNIVHSPI
jgi:hypothetical protein